jgi:hypothetical protein
VPPPFEANLILNGDAEAGDSSPDGRGAIDVPGWTLSGDFTVVRYGFQTWPTPSDPGPPNRGRQFFSGGVAATSQATQTIDLAARAGVIDTGDVTFELAGFLGGFSSQGDNAVLTAIFRDGFDGSLGEATIGPVTAADRGNRSGLLARSTSGAVPVGTRRIELVLVLSRVSGSFNDGYADNLSLVLTSA